MTYHAKVIAGGKIVIPADLRREFGINDGDTLVIQREGATGFSVTTFANVIEEAQRRARSIFGADYTVDRFLNERRADWREE